MCNCQNSSRYKRFLSYVKIKKRNTNSDKCIDHLIRLAKTARDDPFIFQCSIPVSPHLDGRVCQDRVKQLLGKEWIVKFNVERRELCLHHLSWSFLHKWDSHFEKNPNVDVDSMMDHVYGSDELRNHMCMLYW
jgi:hypothetical protein